MSGPTKKQTLLLEFIAGFTDRNNYSPSYREIMHGMGLRSVSAVAEHVENCVAAGYLRKVPKSARSLEVIGPKTYDETVTLFTERLEELEVEEPDGRKKGVLIEAAGILGIKL